MKKSRFTETQIVAILKEYESVRIVLDLCREYGISKATFFKWKSKYGGMEVTGTSCDICNQVVVVHFKNESTFKYR